MELLSMYISSQGPLRGRCFSFDPRYKLEKEGQAFSIKFSNDDEAGSEFWLTPYPKDEPHGTSVAFFVRGRTATFYRARLPRTR